VELAHAEHLVGVRVEQELVVAVIGDTDRLCAGLIGDPLLDRDAGERGHGLKDGGLDG
jgi:hypothetical protein